MRLRAAFTGMLLVPAMVTLAACGSSSDADSDDPAQQGTASSQSADATDGQTPGAQGDSDSADADADAEPVGPEVPADTEVADPVSRDQMPTATGDFGDKPTVTVPDTPPPDSLQRLVLAEGDGPTSTAGSWLTVNYLGQVWGGEVFDNSYDRGQPFTIRVGGPQPKVVAGWNIGLQGVQEGSRLLLSLPPRDGYGASGNQQAGITGTDTLVFVVDVLDVYSPTAAADPDAAMQQIPAGWPTVEGDPGEIPTVAVPSSLPEPSNPGTTVVAKGNGEPVQPGVVLVQYVASSWDGSHVEQSWPDPDGDNPLAGIGPEKFPVNAASPFAGLLNVPVGSRVLLRTPADSKTGIPAAAWAVDVLAQLSVSDG